MVGSRGRVLRLGVVVLLAAACSSGGAASLTPTSTASTAPSASPAGPRVEITLKDFSIATQPQAGNAGPVSFHVSNQGTVVHEFDIYQTALPIDGLPVDKSTNKVDEVSGSVRTIEASISYDPGHTATVEVTLPAGRYYFVCNQPGHYQLGMRIEYIVR